MVPVVAAAVIIVEDAVGACTSGLVVVLIGGAVEIDVGRKKGGGTMR